MCDNPNMQEQHQQQPYRVPGTDEDLKYRLNHMSDTLSNNTTSTRSIAADDAKHDGCIILGNDGHSGNKYVTRYRIHRDQQRAHLRREAAMKECCPCRSEEKKSAPKFTWDVIRSESFLVTLHITALVFGVLKEALDMRIYAEDLHLIHSSIETAVALLIVIIRVVSARHGFHKVHEARASCEIIHEKHDALDVRLHRMVHIFTGIGIFLWIADFAAFFMFYFIPGANLGWTILSNNFTLVVIAAMTGQVRGVMNEEIGQICQDQHKAVVYETVLLMTEVAQANDIPQKKASFARAERFCKALRDTETFRSPEYIGYSDANANKGFDAITTMEVVSMV